MRIAMLLLFFCAVTSTAHATPVLWVGNGHYYDFVPGYLTFNSAKPAAEAQTFQGVHGTLTTITSQAENDFFGQQFGQGGGQTLLGWLGGFQDTAAPDYAEPAGGYRWVTGEQFVYTSWWTDKNFPDDFGGHQDFIRTQPVGSTLFWDDIENNPGANAVNGYFVEFAVPEPCTVLLATVPLLSLRRRRA